MQTRTVSILSLRLAMAVFFCAGPLSTQPVQASQGHDVANEAWSKIQRAAPMLITTNTSRIRTVAVIKTGSASGRTFARRTQDGRAWRHANLDNLKISTSHWGAGA